MTIIAERKESLKIGIPDFKTGDTVKVHQKIKEGEKSRIQILEGLVIARKGGSGISASFTVRAIISGVGVERIFPLHSPNIAKIEVTKPGRVRTAKIYYVRKRAGNEPRFKKAKKKNR
ncbi:MAG: 50S ribosomal protein L19 [Candidatus Doudnabacteria bacterium CG10_big_fil_rev_8_21_14_0_10_41_10]|uniref:Large ribosomal subunit protein bL19 n=1 Tax=Candidatus Doudnabacteria bacterium CG10_big_fil_rev_8_21_14_0_10_41_10 TaxID=1974551 RepID=A0A2H0VD83_9BACT|nr:MAG: 50S ribosomal protein L19 [Candidatus Doudnabacteria bacterium CG10_big_fil_rev_8_21_14_0_10_41_10]